MNLDPRLHHVLQFQPHPLLFVTISGAHLYGFPSPDSDYDLRGLHLLPPRDLLSLYAPQHTIELSSVIDGLEIDLVTHDAHKFFTLMLKRNGYVLEQLYSPLVLHDTPEFHELRDIAQGCITKHHAHHYFGFAETQWKLFEKENPRRVKPLLYTYRVLLTGIHLMQTGRVEANLLTLNARFNLPHIPALISRKLSGPEQSTLPTSDLSFHQQEYHRLRTLLEQEYQRTPLPDTPTAKPALNDLLLRLRRA